MEQSNKRSAQDAQLEDRQVSAKETKVNNSTNNNEQDDKQKEEDVLLIRTSDSKGVYPISRQAFSLLPYFQALTHGFKETNNNEIMLNELTWKELITILRVMETYIGIQTDRKTSIGMAVEFKYLYSDILQALAAAFVSSGYNIENITELFSTAELINFSLLQQAISYYICKKNYGPTFITHIVDDNSKNAGTVSLNNKMASLVNFHHFLQHKQLLTKDNSKKTSNNAAPWIYIINRGLMSCQGLENVPHIEDVQQMMINHNPIESIDSQDFKKLTALQHLNLSNNNINSIDPELFKLLTQLKTIDLSHNKLPALPGTISNLTQLQSLIAESNLIPRLDHNTLTSMQQLQLLDLSNNKLVQLPALNLPNLETLLINNNSFFRDVPQDIVNLTNLKALNLLGTLLARDSQRIKELRKAFGKRVKITTRHSKNNN